MHLDDLLILPAFRTADGDQAAFRRTLTSIWLLLGTLALHASRVPLTGPLRVRLFSRFKFRDVFII